MATNKWVSLELFHLTNRNHLTPLITGRAHFAHDSGQFFPSEVLDFDKSYRLEGHGFSAILRVWLLSPVVPGRGKVSYVT